MELITNINVYQEYQLSKFDSTMGIWPYIPLISWYKHRIDSVSYTHLRAHET